MPFNQMNPVRVRLSPLEGSTNIPAQSSVWSCVAWKPVCGRNAAPCRQGPATTPPSHLQQLLHLR